MWRLCKKAISRVWAKSGRNDNPDIVEGIVLLQKGGNSLPALAGLRQKIHDLNTGNLLPPGMQIKTIYDRTKLINTTTTTVRHVDHHRTDSGHARAA